MRRLLLIDNYDSFTYNLEQLLGALFEGEVVVRRNDAVDLAWIEAGDFDGIVVSPGPKKPKDAPLSLEAIRRFHEEKPILGVCLGMQCLNEAFGGETVRAPRPTHGKTSRIRHSGAGVFEGVPRDIRVARYHSLMARVTNPDLEVTATNDEGVVMGLQLRGRPVWGVQFHPESFLTEYGDRMARNYLELVGRSGPEGGAGP